MNNSDQKKQQHSASEEIAKSLKPTAYNSSSAAAADAVASE